LFTRFIGLFVSIVSAVILIAIAVANRKTVVLVLDPISPDNPVISLALPFYAYLFAMLILGVVLGGIATWFSQGKWRRMARERALEAARWKGESDRLLRERDHGPEKQRQLTVVR
jgi:hypothetical protein